MSFLHPVRVCPSNAENGLAAWRSSLPAFFLRCVSLIVRAVQAVREPRRIQPMKVTMTIVTTRPALLLLSMTLQPTARWLRSSL